MATGKYLTIICVLRDGSHILYQSRDTIPGHSGVRIGSHLALRQREHGADIATLVVCHGDVVTEHQPVGSHVILR